MTTLRARRRGTRHRKQLRSPLQRRAALVVAATLGLALIIAVTGSAFLGAFGAPPGGTPTPTVTVTVTVHRPGPTVTVTELRPGPTVTVTELRPGPTVTIRCQHFGRHCGQG